MAKKIQVMVREANSVDTLLLVTSDATIVNYKNTTVQAELERLESSISTIQGNITTLTQQMGNKADKATTLAGYGITDGVTKTELNTQVSNLNNAINQKASKNKRVNVNIPASWSGSAAPFTVNVPCTGITASNDFIVTTQTGLTKAQFDAFAQAGITCSGQTTNQFTLKAWGTKPTIVLPITVVILGS